ncbi:MAG: DUF4848 domain-containing protein [Prevotella sp.]|jgi:hypothetical protein|nr:DUF4848 domain-containing protein [Prevotella sp.]
MKKTSKVKRRVIHFVLFSCALALFNACSNDDLDLSPKDNTLRREKDVEVVNINDYITGQTKSLRSTSNDEISQTAIRFKDETAYERTIAKLEAMNEEERSQWYKTLEGFNSLQAIFEKAMEDVEDVDETEESYMNFKAKYDKYLYFPMYEEDYGVYIPIIEQEIASVANPDGLVIVGNEVRSLKNITNYSDLQQSGQAYYEPVKELGMQTKALNPTENIRSKYIGQESSGWVRRGKRKLQIKFGRRSNQVVAPSPFRLYLHMEVSFRKKTWIGWVNYSSITDTKVDYTYGGIKYTYTLHKNNYSSHDWFDSKNLPFSRAGATYNGIAVYSTPVITASFRSEFRGFDQPYYWSCTLPEVLFTNN